MKSYVITLVVDGSVGFSFETPVEDGSEVDQYFIGVRLLLARDLLGRTTFMAKLADVPGVTSQTDMIKTKVDTTGKFRCLKLFLLAVLQAEFCFSDF